MLDGVHTPVGMYHDYIKAWSYPKSMHGKFLTLKYAEVDGKVPAPEIKTYYQVYSEATCMKLCWKHYFHERNAGRADGCRTWTLTMQSAASAELSGACHLHGASGSNARLLQSRMPPSNKDVSLDLQNNVMTVKSGSIGTFVHSFTIRDAFGNEDLKIK